MPFRRTIGERYWGWCSGWLGIPYPCRKTRTREGWGYSFEREKERRWLFACQQWGCENGIMYYQGWSACLALGTEYGPARQRCYPQELSRGGNCESFPGPIPPGPF